MTALSEIVADICARAGIPAEQIDVSDLEGVEVDGYVLTRETAGLPALSPLRVVGAFDIVDQGDKLVFVRRGGAPAATIAEDELGARYDGEEPRPLVTTTKAQDVELPRQIRLRYPSIARDYEIGEQLSPQRLGTDAVNEITVDCPVIMTDDQAARVVEVLFREAWESRYQHEFTLGPDRHAIEPSDVLLLPVDGRLRRVRVQSIDDQGLQVRRVVAVRDSDGSYVSTAVADAPHRPPSTIPQTAGTEVVFLDLPALLEQHNDAGFYAAAFRDGEGSWPGARLYKSADGTAFSSILLFRAEAIVGTVVSAPSSGDTDDWDDDGEYVIELERGQLESLSDAAVLAGGNAAAVGAPGRWHIFQFGDADLDTSGRYVLTHLLLGRRGTEYLVGTVQPGDRFVLLSGPGIYRVPMQAAEIGIERIYRVVTIGTSIDEAADIPFTGHGQALVPFSPTNVNVDVDTAGDVTITWTRRDRLQFSDAYLPMSEATEAYEVDIIDNDTAETVLRTIQTSTPEIVYTVAEQTDDFGVPNDTFRFRIYQMSAIVGRGIPYDSGA